MCTADSSRQCGAGEMADGFERGVTVDERELAGIIVRMGLARGLDADRLVDELARMSLPGFLDAQAFRASLVDTIEEQWRAELDARVRRLRDQLGGSAPPDGRIEPSGVIGPSGVVAPPTSTAPVTQYDLVDATAVEAAPTGLGDTLAPPRDATQIWDARRG